MVTLPRSVAARSMIAAPLRVEVLGPPRVSWSGESLNLTRRQSRALLYRLAAAPEPLPREHICFLLWPDIDETSARRNLVVLLNHLRRALPVGGALLTTSGSVGLDRRTVWSDAVHTADILTAALREPRIDRLADAVSLYRGPFLEGFALPASAEFEAWLGRERHEWERRYLDALARLAGEHAARGDYPSAIDVARRSLATDELDEAAHRRLIAYYAASGDRAAALRQYERCAAVLDRELHMTPQTETRGVYEAVRDGEPQALVTVAAQPLARRTPCASGTAELATPISAPELSPTLPAPPNPLIGRTEEVAAACALLDGEARLLTLCGPGGSGKTRLALQVAWEMRARLAQGVVFVSLAALSDADLVLPMIARACGLQESSVALDELLAGHLREREMLIVLDTCEHLLAAGPTIAGLLAAAPRLRVLTTSRTVLNLAGEQALHVSPLPLPNLDHLPPLPKLAKQPAVALLLARARASEPAFALTEANAADLAAICVRLDGLPLAVELAAARLKLLSPRALLRRLDHRLSLLEGGPRDLPDRQQTMRATIDWSYRLLDASLQALFERLAIFAGGWTLEAAEQICAGSDTPASAVLDGLQALLDAHLIGRRVGSDDEPHFAMLETVREYAFERLAGRGDADAVAEAHTAYYLGFAERAATEVRGRDAGRWLRLLDEEYPNLISAADRALAGGRRTVALRLAVALGRFWLMRGRLVEGLARLGDALAATCLPDAREGGALEDEVRALAHAAAAELAVPQGDFIAGQGHMRAAVALWRRLGRQRQLALSLLTLSYLERLAGDPAAALATWVEGEALATSLADPEALARVAQGRGRDARHTAETATARVWLEAALSYARTAGDPLLLTHRLLDLVPVTLSTGETERAQAQAEEALALAHEIGHRVATAMALSELGEIARGRGDDEQAARRYIASLRLWREMGNRSDVPRLLHNLAYAALHAGDTDRAEMLFRRCIDQFREARIERGVVEGMAGLACVAVVRVQPYRAARLWGAAEALRDAGGWGMWSADRVEYTRYVARANAAADTPAFAAAWQEGRTLTVEQALVATAEDAVAETVLSVP